MQIVINKESDAHNAVFSLAEMVGKCPTRVSGSGPQTWESAKSLEHEDTRFLSSRFPSGFFHPIVYIGGRNRPVFPSDERSVCLHRGMSRIFDPGHSPVQRSYGMNKLKLTVGCYEYDRTRALFDGTVKFDGVDASFEST